MATSQRNQRSWRAWRSLLLTLPLLALLLAGGCSTLDEQQRKWIFQPSDRTWWGGLAAAEGMQDIWISFKSESSSQDVKLHGLWLPQTGSASQAPAPTLLYLHGARWDVRGSAHRMRRMHELGFSVLGIDYRGFGQSSPDLPSEEMAAEDARAAWDWLVQQEPKARHFLFGHSLGGAIAVDVATRGGGLMGLQGLIVEGSFTSIPDLVSTFKWGWLPLGPFITQRFDSAEKIARVQAPVIVAHGSADSLITPALGRALFDRAPEPKRWMLVQGGSHHNTNAIGQPLYRQAISEVFGLGLKP